VSIGKWLLLGLLIASLINNLVFGRVAMLDPDDGGAKFLPNAVNYLPTDMT
jgi:hypothetical protein